MQVALGDFENFLPSPCHPIQNKGLETTQPLKNDVRELPQNR
jgi:hypothetical protein